MTTTNKDEWLKNGNQDFVKHFGSERIRIVGLPETLEGIDRCISRLPLKMNLPNAINSTRNNGPEAKNGTGRKMGPRKQSKNRGT